MNLDSSLKDASVYPDSSLELDLTVEASIDSERVDFLLEQAYTGDNKPEKSIHDKGGSEWNDVVLSDSRDLTVRSTKQLLKKMQENKLFDAHDYQEKRIVHPSMQKSEIMNTFREIRTKLLQSSGRKNFVLMVVSLRDEMGSSFCAANIGTAFSFEGQKTSLVIDCNLKKSKLNNTFPGEYKHGLTDYLDDGDIEIEDIIYPTGISRMRYIPIGNRSETIGEFFSSDKMSEFLLQIKKRYSDRYIIVNSPPVETSADAAILSISKTFN